MLNGWATSRRTTWAKAPARVAGNRQELLETERHGGDDRVGAPAQGGGQDGAALVEEQAVAEFAGFDLADEHDDVGMGRDFGRGQVGEEGVHHGTFGDGTTISGISGPTSASGLEGLGGLALEGGMEGPDLATGCQGVGQDVRGEPGDADDRDEDEPRCRRRVQAAPRWWPSAAPECVVVAVDPAEQPHEAGDDYDDDEGAVDELGRQEDHRGGSAEHGTEPVERRAPGPPSPVVGEPVADEAGLGQGEADEDTDGEERDQLWVLPPEPTMSSRGSTASTTTP